MSLKEWRVDAPGPDLIEIYAADADPDELIAELLPRDGAWISKSPGDAVERSCNGRRG
jgi:hypothetical protein